MLKIHEILRLGLNEGRSYREIARSCQVSLGAVSKYLTKAKAAGAVYDQIKDMDDQQLRRFLKADGITLLGHLKPLPDCVHIHQELKNRHVTLWLLWEEYKAQNPEGYQYTQFCQYYRRWRKELQCSMRQIHKAGEKMFVDYAGDTVPIYSRQTGKAALEAAIFVACLGASQYTFAEATKDQTLPNWINSHVRSFEYFKGVPELAVIDNLKSGVTKSCRYEPELNQSYADMARHYGMTILPARVRKPRDKAKVENSVLLVERWILARLRKRKFFSVEELNRAISGLLENLNSRPFKKLPGCRRSQYEQMDHPALRPLPEAPYRIHHWKKVKVHIDYHVEVDQSYYSVPYQFIGQTAYARYTDKTVEIFLKNKRIASHPKSGKSNHYETTTQHMPKSHQDYKGWTPDRFMSWAQQIGPGTAQGIHQLLHSRQHLCQSYRRCLGILNLSKSYGRGRVESAAKKALSFNAFSYKTISNILKNHLEDHRPEPSPTSVHLNHKNVRGEDYFRDTTRQPINLKEISSCCITQLKKNCGNSNSPA